MALSCRWAACNIVRQLRTALSRQPLGQGGVWCRAKRPVKFLLGGSMVLGYHRDGNRERLFQPHGRSLESLLETERRKKARTTGILCVWAYFKKLVGYVFVFLRTCEMIIITLPLVITAPLAIQSQRFRNRHWFFLLVSTIEYCGPVFVKLGQWAATRRDLFPPEMCEALAKLQRQTQVHDWESTEQILEDTLGSKKAVSEIFQKFDQVPVGSGCCAQVYKALIDESKLSHGKNTGEQSVRKLTPVAVKILHPRITAQFERDLRVLRTLTGVLSFLFPSLKWLSLKDSLEEFAFSMRIQLDLTTEVENILQFRKDFKNDESIVFPRPILELCFSNLIVETFEDGVHMTQILPKLNQVPDDVRKKLANMGVDLLLKMVFTNNYVHADLHPGNILVRGLEDNSDRLQLVILDSGIVATLKKRDFGNFYETFTAIVKGDGRQVGKLFLERSVNNCQEEESFIHQMDEIVMEARSKQLSLSNVDVADLLIRVFRVLRDHQVKLDANFASVILAIMILEGLGRSLDPKMDLALKATPFLMESKLKELYSKG